MAPHLVTDQSAHKDIRIHSFHHTHTHKHTHARTHAHTHTYTHTETHARTHTQTHLIICLFFYTLRPKIFFLYCPV